MKHIVFLIPGTTGALGKMIGELNLSRLFTIHLVATEEGSKTGFLREDLEKALETIQNPREQIEELIVVCNQTVYYQVLVDKIKKETGKDWPLVILYTGARKSSVPTPPEDLPIFARVTAPRGHDKLPGTQYSNGLKKILVALKSYITEKQDPDCLKQALESINLS